MVLWDEAQAHVHTVHDPGWRGARAAPSGIVDGVDVCLRLVPQYHRIVPQELVRVLAVLAPRLVSPIHDIKFTHQERRSEGDS